jgi:hypothetical protein
MEVMTGLSLLTALFLTFVLVRCGTCSGATSLIATTVGLTYAGTRDADSS